MLVEASALAFERSPVGRYTSTASAVVWCASPSLAGWHLWGRPDETETRAILQVLTSYRAIAPRFDIVADTRSVELVNPPALAIFVPWLVEHQRELRARVRLQANVIRRDATGYLLMGVLASLGDLYPFKTFTEPVEAFRSVAGEQGVPLAAEMEEIVGRVRAVPSAILALRAMLAEDVEVGIDDAARRLSMSSRSLQRALQQHRTSFHDEQTSARFALAQALLRDGDEKVASVARRVGCSERTLTSLFRARTGLTPSDWRKGASSR